MLVHALILSTQEMEAGGSLSSRTTGATQKNSVSEKKIKDK